MDEQRKQAVTLRYEINQAVARLKIEKLQGELTQLQVTSRQPGFWDDSAKAQETMKQIAKLEARAGPWLALQ